MRACSKFGLCSQIGPSEMLMPVYWSAWYHIPEDYNFNIYGHENFTFSTFCCTHDPALYEAVVFTVHVYFHAYFVDFVVYLMTM